MKYSKQLRCLYYIARCSKYLFYAKKMLCICAVGIAAVIGISLFTKGCCGCKALKELM